MTARPTARECAARQAGRRSAPRAGRRLPATAHPSPPPSRQTSRPPQTHPSSSLRTCSSVGNKCTTWACPWRAHRSPVELPTSGVCSTSGRPRSTISGRRQPQIHRTSLLPACSSAVSNWRIWACPPKERRSPAGRPILAASSTSAPLLWAASRRNRDQRHSRGRGVSRSVRNRHHHRRQTINIVSRLGHSFQLRPTMSPRTHGTTSSATRKISNANAHAISTTTGCARQACHRLAHASGERARVETDADGVPSARALALPPVRLVSRSRSPASGPSSIQNSRPKPDCHARRARATAATHSSLSVPCTRPLRALDCCTASLLLSPRRTPRLPDSSRTTPTSAPASAAPPPSPAFSASRPTRPCRWRRRSFSPVFSDPRVSPARASAPRTWACLLVRFSPPPAGALPRSSLSSRSGSLASKSRPTPPPPTWAAAALAALPR